MRFMLSMNYGNAHNCDVGMNEWPAEVVEAHMAFQGRLGQELTEKGELVDAQGLSGPDAARIVWTDGSGAPVVTDGPFPEAKEFLAGYWIVDVESYDRAIEIAATASAAPGPNGPLQQEITVREIMSAPAAADL